VDDHLVKLLKPLSRLAKLLGPTADAIDGALSTRLIRVLQHMLEMTTHLAEASVLDGVHKQTSDIQQIMLMSEQLSAVQEELMQSRIELSKTVPTHALENVEAAAKHEREVAETKIRELMMHCNQIEGTLRSERKDTTEMEQTIVELERQMRLMSEELIQVESYKKSTHGEHMRQMEASLAKAQIKLVDSEAEKDDLEMRIIEMQEELAREGHPPLKCLARPVFPPVFEHAQRSHAVA